MLKYHSAEHDLAGHDMSKNNAFKDRLGRSVVVVLTIKIAIIVLAATFVFGPQQRPQIDDRAVARQILGNSPPNKPEPLR